MAEKRLNQSKTLRQETYEHGKIYTFWCKGCGRYHHFEVGWNCAEDHEFNDKMDKPSFKPALHDAGTGCHLWLKDGMIEYQSDSPHKLAGQHIPLEPLPDEIYRG